jgi:hypothetical protein
VRTLAEVALAYSLQSITQARNGLTCNICLVRNRLSFVLRRSLVAGVGVPRRVRPRLLLRTRENPFAFRNTLFQSLLELLNSRG